MLSINDNNICTTKCNILATNNNTLSRTKLLGLIVYGSAAVDTAADGLTSRPRNKTDPVVLS